MTSKAKHSFAANRDGSGFLAAVRSRMSFAGRGASSGADGSGASSGARMRRGRFALLSIAALAFTGLVLMVASAFASKQVIDHFGASGSLGGEFSQPRGIAVNQTGAGPADQGDIYVADWLNNRIQRFDSDGNFISAWGADVSLPDGGDDYEICTIAADCQSGAFVTAGGNGSLAGNGILRRPESVAVDGDTGNVFVSDRDNRRINVYEGDGTFLFSVGRDVREPDGGATVEICDNTDGDTCRAGDTGSGPGEIGSGTIAGTFGIAVSQPDGNPSTGSIFLADSGNQRVNTYDLDGTNPSSFGSAAEFGSNQPRMIAVDSRGIVYASDSNNSGEIDRYDSENANGGGVGFLASIAAPPLLAGGATATSGLAVHPDSDGGVPNDASDEDILYVLRDPSSGNTVVQQFGPTNDPGLTAAPAGVDDTHGDGAGFSTVQGLGLDDITGRLLISATNNVSGIGSSHRVYILDEIATSPVATIDSGAGFAHGAYEATLTGTVNPNGVPTKYHFEYVDDAQYGIDGFASATSAPVPDDLGAGAATTAQPAQAEVTDLLPGITYHVRLVATHIFDPAISHTSGETTFTTDSLAPSVTSGGADAQETTATVYGYVKPHNQSTDYHFEYGTQGPCSTNPCTSTPVGNAGSGVTPVLVEADLTGLSQQTTYHFQLVAQNASGTTEGPNLTVTTGPVPPAGECPNEVLRQLNNSGNLPDCRAYELVTLPNNGGRPPLASNFANIQHGFQMETVSPSGESVMYQAVGGGISGFPGTGLNDRFVASRTGDGWETEYIGPLSQQSEQPILGGISSDHDYYFFDTGTDHGNNPDQGSLVAYHDCFGCPPGTQIRLADGSMEPIAKGSLGDFNGHGRGDYISPGAGHIIFHTVGGSAVDLPRLEPNAPPTGTSAIYDRTPGGPTKVVSLLPGEVTPAGGQGASFEGVSKDGELVAFEIDDDLYVRVNNSVTYEVTAADYTFGGIRGGHVFYGDAETSNFLNPQTPADLFSFDTATQTTQQITDVGDARFVRVSDDGSRVYFVSESRIDDEGSTGQPNLYLWERADDTTTFVATMAATDVTGDLDGDAFSRQNMAHWAWEVGSTQTEGLGGGSLLNRATPNGSILVFQAVTQLTPFDNAGTSQIYRYDATTGQLGCISCAGGGPATGASQFQSYGGTSSRDKPLPRLAQAHNLSEDGKTVVFESEEDLLPADTNGVLDVYRWRQGEGLALITSGEASTDSYLYGVSPNASDIVVATAQQLVPGDVNVGVRSLYDARVGGGFEPPEEAVTEPCSGDACQGAPSNAPDTAGAASADLQGQGNLPAQRDCSGLSRRAQRLGQQARRVSKRAQVARRRARRAGTRGTRRRARKLTRRAGAASRRAKRLRRGANRCRRANRRAAR